MGCPFSGADVTFADDTTTTTKPTPLLTETMESAGALKPLPASQQRESREQHQRLQMTELAEHITSMLSFRHWVNQIPEQWTVDRHEARQCAVHQAQDDMKTFFEAEDKRKRKEGKRRALETPTR